MSINSPEAFCASLWDWACLEGCFGGKIRPSDIDGCVERNGHFLFLETKLPEARVPMGQSILLERLAKNPMNTVIFIWGKSGDPKKMKLIWRDTVKVEENANIDKLRYWCRCWFKYANGPCPGDDET